MNQKTLSAAGLIALTVTCSAADAPRQNFECDTPAGHFSYWNRTISAQTVNITGTLTVNEIRKDKQWTPTARVVFKSGDESTSFGIRLFALAKITDMYFIEMVKPGGGEKLGLGFVPKTAEPIPFAIHLDTAGQLRVSFAGVDGATSVGDFRPTEIQFSCSTGDFEFKNFAIEE